MSPGCNYHPVSSSVSNIVLCVKALSFMTSVLYKNLEIVSHKRIAFEISAGCCSLCHTVS